jgi:murein L,D-transpeptidase YafK
MLVLLGDLARATEASRDPCATSSTAVVVDARLARLWLCERGHAFKQYAVAVGSGGVGKNAEGDKKTPLGDYSLGRPRGSKEFGIFIPIGYPTDAQRTKGVRGSGIGIHGPKRRFAWAGHANVWLNWTRGCIALATDAEIREIADWVRIHKPRTVHIE